MALLVRFALAGAANTLLGFGVIVALDLGLRLDPHLANAVGYLAGVCASFLLNQRLVFRSDAPARTAGPRFAAAALGAFGLNQIALTTAVLLLGRGGAAHLAAQLAGMATYSTAMFLACRLWVFPKGAADDDGPPLRTSPAPNA